MESNNTTSQQIPSIGGTSWEIVTQDNNTGLLQFSDDNTGVYDMAGNHPKDFYWWQSGASFWAQVKETEKGWFALIEGTLNGSDSGTGNIIAAQQGVNSVYVDTYTMSVIG